MTTALCYDGEEGFHYEVDIETGERGNKIYLEDDGVSYRKALDGDLSWHQRHHRVHQDIAFEDGTPAVRVNTEEMAAIRDYLARLRGEA